jgi:hypothetical protein
VFATLGDIQGFVSRAHYTPGILQQLGPLAIGTSAPGVADSSGAGQRGGCEGMAYWDRSQRTAQALSRPAVTRPRLALLVRPHQSVKRIQLSI